MPSGECQFHVREPAGKFASGALSVKPLSSPLAIATRPVVAGAVAPAVVSGPGMVMWKSYVGFDAGKLFSGIHAIVPTGSVVTNPPSPAGGGLRKKPLVEP